MMGVAEWVAWSGGWMVLGVLVGVTLRCPGPPPMRRLAFKGRPRLRR